MKRILFYGLFFFYGFTNAQNVYIFDSSFKNKLLAADTTNDIAKDINGNFIVIDTNYDGEIQVSEAQQVSELNVFSSNITDLSGIGAFSNLKKINCSGNYIQTLDFSGNLSLESIECSENMALSLNLTGLVNLTYLDCRVLPRLTALNLTGLTRLTILKCGLNSITSLDVSSLTNLLELDCSFAHLSSLNLSGLVNLKSLNCSSNELTSLDITSLGRLEVFDYSYNDLSSLNTSSLTALRKLDCNAVGITSLDLSPFPNLVKLSCHSNFLTTLDVSNSDNLMELECSDNGLTTLNLSNLISLKYLACSYNQLTNLDLSGLSNIEELDCSNNNIATIATQDLANLGKLMCGNNAIVDLDLSHSPEIAILACKNNTLLETVNLKNGYSYTGIPVGRFDFQNTPSLTYMCADEEETDLLQSFFSSQGRNVSVTSYCTVTPGGNYNTISGTLRLDANGNGCDTNDRPQPFIKVKMSNGTEEEALFSNSLANYAFYTQQGTFTLTPATENPSFFSFSPANAIVSFPVVNNTVTTQNFCITPNGVNPDVEVAIAPVVPARPGFDAVYKIVYKNNGNQILSLNSGITLLYNQNLMNFISSSATVGVQTPGRIVWDYTNLYPFESKSFTITMRINRPTDANAVNINDILNFTTSISTPNGDENMADNSFTFRQKVVGSYDPNEIVCLEGAVVSPAEIGRYLHYLIRFENTGTAPAQNIVIRDEIDETEYDPTSVQILDSSHKMMNAKVKGNRMEFFLPNVSLDSGGHGNILLKVKSNENLSVESTVSHRVGIYFDYNLPVLTNDATTVFKTLSVKENELDNSIMIYPNPANKMLNIKADGIIRSVQLFDIQGRILMTQLLGENKVSIDVSRYAAGAYFVKISTDEGAKAEKLIINKN